MPNYGYRCSDCKRKFDVFQTYEAYGKETVTCPHCQSSNVSRKFNRVRGKGAVTTVDWKRWRTHPVWQGSMMTRARLGIDDA